MTWKSRPSRRDDVRLWFDSRLANIVWSPMPDLYSCHPVTSFIVSWFFNSSLIACDMLSNTKILSYLWQPCGSKFFNCELALLWSSVLCWPSNLRGRVALLIMHLTARVKNNCCHLSQSSSFLSYPRVFTSDQLYCIAPYVCLLHPVSLVLLTIVYSVVFVLPSNGLCDVFSPPRCLRLGIPVPQRAKFIPGIS